MSNKINIITLGDIFKNIETEEKAFKFKDYIINLQQENKQLKEQLDVHKILLQTNAPSTCILTELEEFLNHKLEQTGSYNKNDDEDRIEYLMHRYYAFREIGKYIEKLKEKYNGQ